MVTSEDCTYCREKVLSSLVKRKRDECPMEPERPQLKSQSVTGVARLGKEVSRFVFGLSRKGNRQKKKKRCSHTKNRPRDVYE